MASAEQSKRQTAELRRLLREIETSLDDGREPHELHQELEKLTRSLAGARPAALRGTPQPYDTFSTGVAAPLVTIRVRLRSETGTTADASRVLSAINGLVAASVVGVMTASEERDETYLRAWQILRNVALEQGRDDVFYPGFVHTFDAIEPHPFGVSEGSSRDEGKFRWTEPELAVQSSILTWCQRTIAQHDPALHDDLFGFARVVRAQRRSPLLIIGAVALVGLPAALVYSCAKAAEWARQGEAEAGIRQHEKDIRASDASFSRTRASIATRVLEDLRSGKLNTSDAVVQEVLKQASPAIADLGSRTLIERLTVGISQK